MLRFPRKASRSVAAVIVASALALGVTLPSAPALALRIGGIGRGVSLRVCAAPVAEAFRRVIGDLGPAGRGYFVVRIPATAANYRISVLSFDLVARETSLSWGDGRTSAVS